MRLSYSQIQKYNECQTKWKYHYIDNLKPISMGSSLYFGGAIGKALEVLINTKDLDKANFMFIQTFKEIYNNLDVQYSKSDLDEDLIIISDMEQEILSLYEDNQILDDERKLILNQIYWKSLQQKGIIMLDSFNKDILPKIKKVYSTEEKTEIVNDENDSSIGYCDTVIELEGYDKPIILDFKTAAKAYKSKSVKYSAQLAQYLFTLGVKYNTNLAGYVVLLKNITKEKTKICSVCGNDGSGGKHKTCAAIVNNKRCDSAWKETIKFSSNIQTIIDIIPESVQNFVIDNIQSVTQSIKNGVYTKNLKHCMDNGYGQECEYFNYCYNKDETGLIQGEGK